MADNSARSVVLERIRKATGNASSLEAASAEWDELRRGYRRDASLEHDELLELLVERLRDYDAQVLRVGPSGVADAVKAMLQARGVRRLVVPAGLPVEVLPEGFEFIVDAGFHPAELDAFDGVVTLATVAIAETGTVVLQNTPGQGRRAATLVPDYHLCVLYAADVVETVPEAMDRLQATATLATTFVSGPSATADIEMTRIKGVHGPRFLDVVLVGGGEAN